MGCCGAPWGAAGNGRREVLRGAAGNRAVAWGALWGIVGHHDASQLMTRIAGRRKGSVVRIAPRGVTGYCSGVPQGAVG